MRKPEFFTSSFAHHPRDNRFGFPRRATGCEVLTLAPGDKIDFYRVVPGAGLCTPQG